MNVARRFKPACLLSTGVVLGLFTTGAMASSAATSADADSRDGASATANFTGDTGFARTDTRSGRVNIGRGLAVGVDENGVSLSVSNAIATRHGPAVGATFNMTVGRDGVSTSNGVSVARGGHDRSVRAGGETGTDRGLSAFANGHTRGGGTVTVKTEARDDRIRDRRREHHPRIRIVEREPKRLFFKDPDVKKKPYFRPHERERKLHGRVLRIVRR